MSRMIGAWAVVALLAAQGMALRAGTIAVRPAGVSLWLPDGWEVDSDEDGYTRAGAPGGDAYCVLEVLQEGGDLETALYSCEDVLADEIDDFSSTGEDRRGEINGMEAIFISGEGERDDAGWVVAAALVSTGRSVLLLSFGCVKGKAAAFAPVREKFVGGLRKLE